MGQFLPHIWLIGAVAGMVLSFLTLREAAKDYLSNRILTNGRRATGIVGFIGEILRFFIYVFFAGIGIYYLAQDQTVQRPGVGLFMLAALLLLLVKTALQLWLNIYLFRTSMAILERGSEQTQEQIEDEHFGIQRRELEALHIEEDK